MMRSRSRSRMVAEAGFWSLVILGGLSIGLIAFVGIRGGLAWTEARIGQTVVADCGCSTVVSAESGIAWTGGASALLAFSVLASIGLFAFFAFRRSQRAIPTETAAPTGRLKAIAADLGLGDAVVEARHPAGPIFCAGLFRQRLYLDPHAAERLTDEELKAVLEHERYHLHHRDSLRRWTIDVMTFPLKVLPGFRAVIREYLALVELAADESAMAARGNADGLGRALLKFVEPTPSAVPSFAGSTNRRIDQLLGRRSWRNTIQFLGLVFGLGLVLTLAVRTADAGVTKMTDNLRTTAVGQCQQVQMPTCIVPPLRSTLQPGTVKFMSTP